MKLFIKAVFEMILKADTQISQDIQDLFKCEHKENYEICAYLQSSQIDQSSSQNIDEDSDEEIKESDNNNLSTELKIKPNEMLDMINIKIKNPALKNVFKYIICSFTEDQITHNFNINYINDIYYQQGSNPTKLINEFCINYKVKNLCYAISQNENDNRFTELFNIIDFLDESYKLLQMQPNDLKKEDFEPNQTVIQTIVSKINFIFALQLAKELESISDGEAIIQANRHSENDRAESFFNRSRFFSLDSTRFQQNTDTKPMISLTLVGIICEDWKKNKWVTFVSSNETLFDCSKGGSFRFQEMQKMIIENQLFPTILLYK